jgi:FkbH-like protein
MTTDGMITEPRTAAAGGEVGDTFADLMARARGPLSYSQLADLVRARRRLSAAGFQPPAGFTPVRVAVAGNATTTYLVPALSLLLETHGIAPEMHEVAFGSVEAELLRPDSALAAFRPQLLVLVQTPLAITDWPPDTAGEEEAARFAEARVRHVLGLCRAAHDRLGCEVVLDNWHALPHRPHGSWARRLPGERNAITRRMNALLDREAPPWVHLHDVEGLAAVHGLSRWVDWRFWFHAKQPVGFESLGAYLSSLAATAAAIYRATAKCIVLDLDNTLWGGVVGDDGLTGIRVRQGDPQGEAFQAFQRHLLRFKQRGILLAVCSKNEVENARAPFRDLPDMVLKLDDFVAFKANWDPKPQNIRAIATELNLGLDALAFVDDNPAERALVRSALPTVRVVELPDDPADYPAALDRTGWFEIASLSSEDLERTQQYLANARREEAATATEDYDAYLASLTQQAQVRPFEPAQLDRITQLVNKTNQFNLTTQRTTRGEIEQLMNHPDVLTATVRLSDRFGDNGLIAVWYGSITEDRLHVDQWLMSCRVFNRGVEQMLMNHVVALARARGVREIIGEYRPTAKNGLVRDLYPRLGFQTIAAHEGAADGAEFWSLMVAGYKPLDHAIAIDPPQPR